jgi:hypothetical protein
MSRMRARLLLLAVLTAALGACGAGPSANAVAAVDRASRSVQAADEAGARADAMAGDYLERAERELHRAGVQLRAGDPEGAQSFGDRAGADAAVARMLAILAAARDAAQRSDDDAEALSRALDRGPQQ